MAGRALRIRTLPSLLKSEALGPKMPHWVVSVCTSESDNKTRTMWFHCESKRLLSSKVSMGERAVGKDAHWGL